MLRDHVLSAFRAVVSVLAHEESGDTEQGGGTSGYSTKSPDNASYPEYLFDLSH